MRYTHIQHHPHHGHTTHPAADQKIPSLPPDLDLTLLPEFDNLDQLTYLADYLADHRHLTLLHAWQLLLTTAPGCQLTAYRIGCAALYLAKIFGLAPELATLTNNQLISLMHCSKDTFYDTVHQIHTKIRALHPRSATTLTRLTRSAKVTPANTSRRKKHK